MDNITNHLLELYDIIKKLRMNEVIKKSSIIINEIITLGKKNYMKEIDKFDLERNKYNKTIKPIFKKVLKFLNQLTNDLPIDKKRTKLILASSYGANMNLPNESDLDFIITIKNMSEDDLLKMISYFSKNGFIYKEKRGLNNPSNIHYVLYKIIDGIEVELKIRDEDISKSVILLHKKIDHKLNKNIKKILTYFKFLFKKSGDKKLYNAFKAIFYTYMFNGIKNNFVLI